MATTAQSIFDRFAYVLKDESNIRWTESEFEEWLNAGQFEIVRLLPSAYTEYATLAMVAGSKQTCAGMYFHEAVRNASGAAVSGINSEALDVAYPDWHTQTGAAAVKFFTRDPREPRVFYVYPPNDGNGSVVVFQTKYPSGTVAVGGNIDLPDEFADALLNYCLYRAFSKDFEVPSSVERSQLYLGAFTAAVTPPAMEG
jgi:hypothetical protein